MALQIHHPVDSQDIHNTFIDAVMSRDYVLKLKNFGSFRDQQIRDSVIQLYRQGKEITLGSLMHAIRYPGNPLISAIMQTGNYTYPDIICFLRYYNGENPTVQEFHDDYRQKKGNGIEALEEDVQIKAREIHRMQERYEERSRVEHQVLREALTETQGNLVITQNQLHQAQLEINTQRLRANNAEQNFVDKQQQLHVQTRVADFTVKMLHEAEEEKRILAEKAEEEKRILAEKAEEEKRKAEEEKRIFTEKERSMAAEIEKLRALLLKEKHCT